MRGADGLRSMPRSSACAASLSYDDAFAIMVAHAAALPAETIPLGAAGGRVLAEPLRALIDSPPRPVAAMDGYAVRRHDLLGGARQLIVRGVTVAGDVDPGRLEAGEARRIMTGAPMPPGGDIVLPWETVQVGNDTIIVSPDLPRRRHVRSTGCDFAKGTQLLEAGTRLGPGALALAAAGSHGRVAVRPLPRVSIIATGDELVAPGRVMSAAQCPDSLSLAIAQLSVDQGGTIMDRLLLRDDPAKIARAAAAAIAVSDILVMIGGAARGDRDFAKVALDGLGLRIVFADVAMKPGKPVWYGRIGGTHVLGLPGNPLAALTTARLFLAPLLSMLGGRDSHEILHWTKTTLAAPIAAVGSRESFSLAFLTAAGALVMDDQPASGHMALGNANALVRRPAGMPPGVAGDRVLALAL